MYSTMYLYYIYIFLIFMRDWWVVTAKFPLFVDVRLILLRNNTTVVSSVLVPVVLLYLSCVFLVSNIWRSAARYEQSDRKIR